MGMEESVLKLKLPLTKSFNLESGDGCVQPRPVHDSQSPSPSINPSKTLTLSTSMFAILLLGRRRHFLKTARRVAYSSQENAALNGG
ncbi:hypothetical protein CISIN_1g036947mg [Citrus sinensis]|uniref:Uncharacterized protein n=1 Tax=Citrus sinensis TaxID=2711 RepID=A0A067D7R1_CITSI|nr:hypothetical protein CISIN_1g036947mg [Citrus sinensis]